MLYLVSYADKTIIETQSQVLAIICPAVDQNKKRIRKENANKQKLLQCKDQTGHQSPCSHASGLWGCNIFSLIHMAFWPPSCFETCCWTMRLILRTVYTGDFRGDFCCDFKRDFAAIWNRPCKLQAIQIAVESQQKSQLKSQQKSPV